MKRAAFLAVGVLLVGFGPSAPPAQAGFTMTLVQQGANVVATGSGTIDFTDLTVFGGGVSLAVMEPNAGTLNAGPVTATGVTVYSGITGPKSFGSGGETFATFGSGDLVDIRPFPGTIGVPAGYVSGNPLSDSLIFQGYTFSSLGVTPGTYVWTWGTGADADSYTLNIDTTTATPEPASLTLLGLGVVGLAGYGWRRKRTA